MINHRANNQLAAITLGMILLGGTILGSIPFAFADHNDDKKAKLKAKLKDLLEKIKAKIEDKRDRDKCPEKFKYGEICDKEDPEIEIEEPKNKDKLPKGMITIEIEAEDDETGIEKVEVRINNGPFLPATQVDDDEWEFKVNLEPGKYRATAKATDLVGNMSRDQVNFRVV